MGMNVAILRRLIMTTAMAMDYNIRGSIESLGSGGYAAIVVAIPEVPDATTHRAREVCRTRAQAAARVRELVVMIGKAIRTEGGNVVAVRTEE